MTCHNRREKTLACIKALFYASLPLDYSLSVFLVDDGSIDGTSDAISEQFPHVNIIKGNGNLFWNKGMRLAWDTAFKYKDYDFYLWLNDDTILERDALKELLASYIDAIEQEQNACVITGACKNSNSIEMFSYGGRTDSGPVIPNGKIQECKYINGNVVLIPREVFNKLGNLSQDYTHSMGDYDYGLRALRNGFKCYTTKKYIGVCDRNVLPLWCDPHTPIMKRIKLFFSPKGLNIKEYIVYKKRFFGWRWIFITVKVIFRVLIPGIYQKISKHDKYFQQNVC